MQEYPNGAEFAFSILDDTDDATTANAPPFYELLYRLGMRTTKTVWPLSSPPEAQGIFFAGETLESAPYAAWVRTLQEQGFELAFHNASMASSIRDRSVRALERLRSEYDCSPRIHANHGQNRENLYWGAARYDLPVLRHLIGSALRSRPCDVYEGEIPDSPYFWGDIAAEQFDFVRSFAFTSLDLSRFPFPIVYHDPRKEFVRRWFITADAPDAQAFARLVTRAAVNRMRERCGFTIVSTHVGKQFVDKNGTVHPAVADALAYVASLKGWFPPVSTLLDHVSASTGVPTLTTFTRARLELLHVLDRVRTQLFRP